MFPKLKLGTHQSVARLFDERFKRENRFKSDYLVSAVNSSTAELKYFKIVIPCFFSNQREEEIKRKRGEREKEDRG